jgi:hypothetical protein
VQKARHNYASGADAGVSPATNFGLHGAKAAAFKPCPGDRGSGLLLGDRPGQPEREGASIGRSGSVIETRGATCTQSTDGWTTIATLHRKW